MTAMLHLALPAQADQVANARAAIGEVCDCLGLEGDLLADIRLAVSEAATGCILHSASGSAPAAMIGLDASVEGDSLEVVVCDSVAGLVRGPIRGGGRGLGMQIVRQLADWTDLSSSPSRGLCVVMRFVLPAGVSASAPATRKHCERWEGAPSSGRGAQRARAIWGDRGGATAMGVR
jgi:anti-sigma regulatory factor (Ser/Thr protein kinase)